MSAPPTGLASLTPLLSTRLAGHPLVVLLDIDGTLSPIAPRPEDAIIPAETMAAVRALVERDDVHLALVTGRSASDARRMVPLAVWVVGNHGAEVVDPRGALQVDAVVAAYRDEVAGAAADLERIEREWPGTQLENKTWTLSLHYRRADPACEPELRLRVENVARERHLRLTEGKKVLELRPPVDIHKGSAILGLLQQLDVQHTASVLFAGDDRTDEDAFVLLRENVPHSVTVRVSEDPNVETAAEFLLPGPPAVRELLERLAHRS